ncbi:thymidine kinase [Myxococcota bacterium]|nr:thymidine kinase [Myxococcota bacterium]
MPMLPRDAGWIHVICGPMFSGKTEELIRLIRRAMYARQQVQLFKPKIDTRYDEIEIVSHSKQSLKAQPIENASEILDLIADQTTVVGIDEAQFFDRELVRVCQRLANRGIQVIIAGLDLDFRGVPFAPMPDLLAIAEQVTKAQAICMVCGNPAGRSQRLSRESDQVLLGATESYEARCRRCHTYDEPEEEQPRLL